MDEQQKKLQDLKEGADQIFQEALSDFKLQSPLRSPIKNVDLKGGGTTIAPQNPFQNPIVRKKKEEVFYKDKVISIDSNHRVEFHSTKSTIENSIGSWERINWSSDNFSWMAKAAFEADSVKIKGTGDSREVVEFENCIWERGDFRGKKFLRGKFGADKDAASFVGQFGPGALWLANPFAFVDGTTKEKETILGMNNITNLNQKKFRFSILRVVPGNKIVIEMQDGSVHEIFVIKRLDGANSKFHFQVKNGETNKIFKLFVKWSYLRGNSKEELADNTVFSNSQIPGLFTEKFGLGFNSPVTKVMVTEDTSYEEEIVEPGQERDKSSEELASSQETFDLIKAPLFGVRDIQGQPITIKGKRGQYKNNVGRVHFNFTNNDQLRGFKNTVKNLENQVLRADLTQLKSALKNKVIDGAPTQFPYLSNLIGPMSKEKSKIELDQNLSGSMSRIESLLKNFVDTMVFRVKRKDGIHDVANEKVKELAKDGIKRFLGISSEGAPAAPAPAPKSGLKSKGPATLQEAIREVISKNLKHF